ncbi:MAG: hypothetical protein K2U26_05620, partial [Cyclobacteriaceae bacterium]|nr:hypothetical protein [Cyclobacteriaceae bacterium]
MRKLILLLGFIGLLSFRAFSQFTSVQDGNWNLGATWGFPGNNTAGSGFPSIGQTALVQNNVTIPASFSATITDVTVDVGVYLTIASTGTLNLNGVLEIVDDGLGGNGFLDVYGTLVANQGSSFLNDGATNTKVYGIYRHNFTTSAGNILQARWNTGSTCQVVGYTSNTTAPGFVGQSFHHFTWDCPNGSGGSSTFISLGGQLTDISGNLTVSATGGASRTLRLFDNTSGNTLSIIGDLIVNSSGRLVFSTTGNTNAVTVGGNLRIENTAAATSTVTTSGTSTTITVNGNFSMIPAAATTFNLASLSGGVGTMNILGSFSINSSSTLSANSSATASINFNGTNIQTFSNSGNASSRINYTISSSSILDLGTSAIVGTGILTNNGTLRVGSTDPNGPIQLNTVSGNIRNTVGNRVYNSGSTVTYNGASKQFIGDGHPTGAGVTTRINNSSNVAITASFVIVGSLILDNGNLEVGSNTLTLNGTFTPNSNSLVTTTNSNISVGGTGSLGTLAFSGSTIINSFVLNRTSGGSVTLGSNLGIKNFGTFTHQAGTLILNGNTLTISGDFSQAGGTIQTNSSSSIIIDGSGTLPASISLGGTNLNTLTIIRSTPTVSIAPSHIISNLNLNDGTLN